MMQWLEMSLVISDFTVLSYSYVETDTAANGIGVTDISDTDASH